MTLLIRKPGPQSTVQDLGRTGYRFLGVPAGGACDAVALRIGNLLLGNPPDGAALEVALGGLELVFETHTRFALTGAAVGATLDGERVPGWHVVDAPAGAVLHLGYAARGARIYLNVAGGIDVPPVLGSRATGLLADLGGFKGRAVEAGDRLPLGEVDTLPPPCAVMAPGRGQVLRVLPGPEWAQLSREAQRTLLSSDWTVSPASNRMGARLGGPAVPLNDLAELDSHAVLPGVVQLPPSGQPILLLADAQTTGGYAKPLMVIEADLWRAAQFRPGEALRFVEVDMAQALAALAAQRQWLERIERSLQWQQRAST
ncbi:biotin-dependent carboxyltransferase family protein [Chitiniphilus eburneus]|uniref:Biotin-dependent carboxyltransferase family protein n=1 Tax=Chitiniphilus eburneus TaxID=2571148 RepID=A0A4U0PSN0_9NEIS|nr:biotin-dependent carboxyltransferase family protein [Chitiniphilus eburneus]TJZ71030.1 biotin-dependent carboxyltransferase family protein [Chitiniphilus eburneus]